jgi:hypothetical protein
MTHIFHYLTEQRVGNKELLSIPASTPKAGLAVLYDCLYLIMLSSVRQIRSNCQLFLLREGGKAFHTIKVGPCVRPYI